MVYHESAASNWSYCGDTVETNNWIPTFLNDWQTWKYFI